MGILQDLQLSVTTFIAIGLFVATMVALGDLALRKPETFEAADKLTKKGWSLILVLVAGMELLLGSIGLFVGAIATIVYFVDVRPAVAAYSRKRR